MIDKRRLIPSTICLIGVGEGRACRDLIHFMDSLSQHFYPVKVTSKHGQYSWSSSISQKSFEWKERGNLTLWVMFVLRPHMQCKKLVTTIHSLYLCVPQTNIFYSLLPPWMKLNFPIHKISMLGKINHALISIFYTLLPRTWYPMLGFMGWFVY